jgi:CHAT domain-containing protein
MDEVASLPEGARLVLLFPGEHSLFLWVYDRNGLVSWKQRTIARDALYRRIAAFRALIDEMIGGQAKKGKGRGFGPAAEADEKNPAWYRENCRQTREVLSGLHGDLVVPIAAEIADADPLLLMPYGQLNYLPFEALLDEEGRFLGERKRIAYFIHKDHLTRSLRRLERPPERGEEFWEAFADPVGRLGEAVEETNEIGALFPRRGVRTGKDGTATEGSLLLLPEECTILHFATHGFLNGVRPSDTYLELAPDAEHDGKLMQREIFPGLRPLFQQRQRLRLVVLSACETARAQDAPEAEVLGLPDKFAAAGLPSVVASLWSVYKWSTTDFMIEFYRRLAAGEGTAGALRDARLALLADRDRGRYAHPYYWAPFLLFGDWR